MKRPIKIMLVLGTRPEAIKMAPVFRALSAHPNMHPILCVTGQHREMLDQVLEIFDLAPDFDLNVMKSGQSLSYVTASILSGLDPIIKDVRPDWVFVHGDTTTTAAASLCAFYNDVKLGHIEAGLRTHNLRAPWPEEMNRRLTSIVADAHFAPTVKAQDNLLAEGIPASAIAVTGNTVIDALLSMSRKLEAQSDRISKINEALPQRHTDKKLILVTGHRRESFGVGLENICDALEHLAQRDDVQIIYPVHLNPQVKDHVAERLGGIAAIDLIAPLDYAGFVYLMTQAYLIITDSGGIQEEAPALDIPVLVTRETSERPEAIETGAVKLVGHDVLKIVTQTEALLDDPQIYNAMSQAKNPYGDGEAAQRILEFVFSKC